MLSPDNISDIWITSTNAEKTYQQTDFNSILNVDLNAESEIKLNAEMEFIDLNSTNLSLNLENLNSGYYKVLGLPFKTQMIVNENIIL